MVTKNSGISDKKKLLGFLYKNPDKLAIKLAKFLYSEEESLEPVKFKAKGQGYYYDISRRKASKFYKIVILLSNYSIRSIFDLWNVCSGLIVILYFIYKGLKYEN